MSWMAFVRYSFGLTAAPPPWRYFLRPCGHASRQSKSPLKMTFYLAFRPRLMAVIDFIRASLRRYQFFLRLTAIFDFSLPHGKYRFHSAWRRFTPHGDNWFFLRLTAIIDFSLPHGKNRFHPPDGDSRLTAISIFSLPHGDNQFFFASRQELISFHLHGDSRLTAILIFSSPHGDNQFFFASRQELISFRLTAIHVSRRYQFLFASRW